MTEQPPNTEPEPETPVQAPPPVVPPPPTTPPNEDTPTEPETPDTPEETEPTDEPKDLIPPTNDETLIAELNAYAEALRQEFAESQSTDTPADVEKHTRDFFKKNIQDAALQVVWLAHNSDSDSVRLRACQIIIKEAFDEGVREGDPIKELLNELTRQPTSAPPNS